MRILLLAPLFAFVAAADEAPKPVNGLSLVLSMEPEFAGVGALPFRATLYNASGTPLAYRLDGERPALEFVLERKGDEPVRKPLPDGVEVHRTAGRLAPMGHAWLVQADLRQVFGTLAPGRYGLRVVHGAKGYNTDAKGFAPAAVPSLEVAFDVIETTLEDARAKSPASEGVPLRLVEKEDGTRVVRVTNLHKSPLTFLAYHAEDGREPLDSLVIAERWTGRRWTGGVFGICGTGLVRVTLHPGQTRELRAPALDAGIRRLVMDFTDAADRPLKVVSEAFLVGP